MKAVDDEEAQLQMHMICKEPQKYSHSFVPCSRCTGYRPILDAFRVFAKADPSAYTEEAIEASQTAENGHATNGHANGATNGHSNGHSNGAQGTSPSSSSDLSASTSTDPDDKGSEPLISCLHMTEL